MRAAHPSWIFLLLLEFPQTLGVAENAVFHVKKLIMTCAFCNFHNNSHYPIMRSGRKTNLSWQGSPAVAKVRALHPHSGGFSVDHDQEEFRPGSSGQRMFGLTKSSDTSQARPPRPWTPGITSPQTCVRGSIFICGVGYPFSHQRSTEIPLFDIFPCLSH